MLADSLAEASSVAPTVASGEHTTQLVTLLAPVFAAGLAAVHLFAGKLQFLDAIPRSRWLSLSGGSAVAYVFVHLLPEIRHIATTIERSESVLVQIEQHVYLIALLGFTTFYGLERLVRKSKGRESEQESRKSDGVFWLHIGSFAVYNALIGYLLLHQEEPGVGTLATFFVAMALHFVVNDYGLREYHGRAYHRYGRWILSVAVFVGLAVGYLAEVSELQVGVLFAFLAGGVILNVIKEELPAERQSRFWAFAVGVGGYALLLLSM